MDASNKQSLLYGDYLSLSTILSSVTLQSGKSGRSVHDEHLFIVVHQVYELWFKQILYELDSVRKLFEGDYLDEYQTLTVVRRLNRVTVIFKLTVDQFSVIETMTPLDFMEFRGYLSTASGFQSKQFRLLENTIGLSCSNRVDYNQQNYKCIFERSGDIGALNEIACSEKDPSLLKLVDKWLQRVPGLEVDGFNFWAKYKDAVQSWLDSEFYRPALAEANPEKTAIKTAEFDKLKTSFDNILDSDLYHSLQLRNENRLSYKGFQGALMLSLYPDEPRFQLPNQILGLLVDMESLMTKWRYNHVMLVQRMLGSKMGTGGSSGYLYLRSTISDRYKVFLDLFNLSTYLIPRQYIPPLTPEIKDLLNKFPV